MINLETFLEKTNYHNDVFLRCVIVGFLAFLKNRFSWTNRFESGDKQVNIPFYYTLTGDNRFIMDAFKDDFPQDRVDSNTDQVPRGVLHLKNWAIKADEFTNPNVEILFEQEVDDELQELYANVKAVPIKLTFGVEVVIDSEIDVFKAWQTFMDNMWIYKFFTFDYNRINVEAVFSYPGDKENPIPREFKFGDNNKLSLKFDLDIHTFYPLLDLKNPIKANAGTQWVLRMWQFNEPPPNIPIQTNPEDLID